MGFRLWLIVVAACATQGRADAEPLVKMDSGTAKPAVVTAWSSSGNQVELTIKDGVEPKTVAAAIEKSVGGVKAKVKAGKVTVIGKAEAELLKALGGVDFGEEDLGALAAAANSEEDSGSGSSLRAKKTADLAKLFADRKSSAQGKVVSVAQQPFPSASVTVQVLEGPEGALSEKIRKGAKIVFVPAIKMAGKTPDWSDENTQLNAGAWFLRAGDRVRIKLGKESNGSFEAVLIDRQ